tara:strand:- start:3762 stop:4982 length:1221 start_codon:yes stop_codon:yes gene_type:complete
MAHVVVVGASVAGLKLAQNLRTEGFDGAITLVDAETDPLYDKPPLSKAYLSGETSVEEIALSTRESLSASGIATRFGVAAAALDPAGRNITLADGVQLSFDILVIATGARARRTPWATVPGVHVLCTRDDADRLRTELVADRHMAVIGAGFIGAEAAATALTVGMHVTIIEPLDAPMGRAMNTEVGGIFADKHREHGAELRFGVSVEDVAPTGSRLRLALTDGSAFEADTVLLGIGAVVNTEWLESSGITLDNGVVCDARLAAVGVSDVYAVGDVARFTNDRHPDSVRLEHWTSAVDQGILVAHNIVHPTEPHTYEPVEYVWSDQYDWKIQIVGRTGSGNWTTIGAPADDRFAVVYGQNGHPVQGAVIVNWPRALIDARRSCASGTATETLVERLHTLLDTANAMP